jgi:hypothetical protein
MEKVKAHPKRRKFHQRRVPPVVMAVILALELAGLAFLMRPAASDAQRGFLVKIGQSYILGWKNLDGEVESANYDDLATAVKFAREKLALLPGKNNLSDDSVEHLWMRSGVEGHVLYWKTLNLPALHRMTFASLDEARFFERVFKMGAYSPSPLGHSVNFVPMLRR